MIRYMAFACALLTACPAAGATFVSGTVRTTAFAGLIDQADIQTDQASTASPGSISASSYAIQTFDGATVISMSDVTAVWTSATAGEVAIDWGWDVSFGTRRYPAGASTALSPEAPSWSYTFIASRNGMFNLTSSVGLDGTGTALSPLRGVDSLSSWTSGGTYFDPSGSSAYSFDLVGGQTYTVGIRNAGILQGSNGATKGQASADIDWSITYAAVVPEPTTWALMIMGFGAAGAALRRRRLAIA